MCYNLDLDLQSSYCYQFFSGEVNERCFFNRAIRKGQFVMFCQWISFIKPFWIFYERLAESRAQHQYLLCQLDEIVRFHFSFQFQFYKEDCHHVNSNNGILLLKGRTITGDFLIMVAVSDICGFCDCCWLVGKCLLRPSALISIS